MSKFKKNILYLLILGSIHITHSQNFSKRKINNLKTQVSQMVEDDKKSTQIMVDKVFSFAELGFQEFETSKYLTSILEENGFEIENGISDVPSAWLATWSNGEGGPTIALGSDIDGIPVASQYPGV
ncbi:MAG: amidohydrolase, partial [Flavobacteriaceae bacterium]|nr:amidohydrolase [Flavobacteriaceae bacterium]